eukprot:5166349-Pleurochrysis_carterae.AAC.1
MNLVRFGNASLLKSHVMHANRRYFSSPGKLARHIYFFCIRQNNLVALESVGYFTSVLISPAAAVSLVLFYLSC